MGFFLSFFFFSPERYWRIHNFDSVRNNAVIFSPVIKTKHTPKRSKTKEKETLTAVSCLSHIQGVWDGVVVMRVCVCSFSFVCFSVNHIVVNLKKLWSLFQVYVLGTALNFLFFHKPVIFLLGNTVKNARLVAPVLSTTIWKKASVF